MTLDQSIQKLQCNMKVIVREKNDVIFDGTIGELSALYTTLGQKQVVSGPYFNNSIEKYDVTVK